MNLKRFNEMAENGITYGQFFAAPGITKPSYEEYGDEKEFIEEDFREELEKFKDTPINFKRKKQLPFGGFFVQGKFNDGDSLFVFDGDGNPEAYLTEYELFNPFCFKNTLVLPGHDSITCYDVETRETKTFHIR